MVVANLLCHGELIMLYLVGSLAYLMSFKHQYHSLYVPCTPLLFVPVKFAIAFKYMVGLEICPRWYLLVHGDPGLLAWPKFLLLFWIFYLIIV